MKKNSLKIFCAIFFFTISDAFCALPFVTDDAAIVSLNQVGIEYFSEVWHLKKANEQDANNLLGQYLGLSYAPIKNLEVTVGGLAGYDFGTGSVSFMNPILQLKTIVFEPKNSSAPTIALSTGYLARQGRGQYYDTATDAYLLTIATKKFFDDDLLVHVNAGPKASYAITNQKNLYRLQLGVGIDAALLRKDWRLILESYNGSPNSPRDSPGFFHSYQGGVKWVKSRDLSFDVLYGTQRTFAGYGAGSEMLYRRSEWIQFGIRKLIE